MDLLRFRNVPVALLLLAALAGCKDTNPAGPDEPEGPVPVLPEVPNPATVVFESSLDAENGGQGTNSYTGFASWNVVDGCVDLHGNGFTDVQPGNGLYVDLDGTCRKAGTIETKSTYDLQPGTYILEFFLAGNQQIDAPDSVVVSLGSVFQEEIRLERRVPFTLFTREIQVSQPTSAKIRFAHAGTDQQGILLDLVRLRRK